ncbi:hypothetical protein MP1412_45 [Pseudomonas phage MP1412]|uniref:Uncharacterized protein n=1 Tax=Pseudomonas phage MP1412 TaxID=1204517 RepID=I6XHM2_9CAUD|nr:hypothetical protein MP1412_45 [Pseudomonas phage MP1412]AFN39616.1 hypothetical protein MP1412_45 [Pseudomonas phage MP1412]
MTKTAPKTAPKTNLLEETINQGRQDVTARRVLSLGDFKVRLTIKSDSYKFQSFARAEVWNPATLSWNQVHSIHYAEMATPEGLCYHPNKSGLKITHFTRDFDRLLTMVKQIIL